MLLDSWKGEASGREIGVLAGRPELEFGRIVDVLTAPLNKQLIVLDGFSKELRVFNEQGAPDGVFGRGGSGPGEFLRPQVLEVAEDQRLFVFESAGTMSTFEITPLGLLFSDRVELGIEVIDACMVGARLFVHGRKLGVKEVIHEFTLEGDPILSFGEVYSSPNRIINHQLSRGHLACSDHTEVLVFSPTSLPEVRAYSLDGDLLWWAEIPEFAPLEFLERGANGASSGPPDHEHHLSVSVVPSQDEPAFLLQIASYTPGRLKGQERDRRLHTFTFSKDGTDLAYWGVAPGIIHEWGSTYVIGALETPYPKIAVWGSTSPQEPVHGGNVGPLTR